MNILTSSFFVPKGYCAITLYPFIILREKKLLANEIVINHERIHLQQQKELLIIGFYLWYFFDFLINLLKYRHWDTAYQNIIFEKEAYQKETEKDYLSTRRFWAFWNFKH